MHSNMVKLKSECQSQRTSATLTTSSPDSQPTSSTSSAQRRSSVGSSSASVTRLLSARKAATLFDASGWWLQRESSRSKASRTSAIVCGGGGDAIAAAFGVCVATGLRAAGCRLPAAGGDGCALAVPRARMRACCRLAVAIVRIGCRGGEMAAAPGNIALTKE